LHARFLLPFLLLLTIVGCHSRKPAEAERRFPIEGRVVSVDAGAKTITLAHHEVVGYMKAMTMPFKVHDAWVFNVVHPGDTVQATLVVSDDAYLENISVTQSSTAADLSNTSRARLPQKGDAVPDFHFVNQEGRPIHLAQFRGQPLLVTFIYSRCPLPDFCIRMSNNFAEVARNLQNSNPAVFAKLQMLSISIDPEFDNPKVLKDYGKRYAGSVDPNLKHWSFATGKPEDIRKAAEYFGLTYQTENGQIVHDLRTALLDRDGTIAEFYTGNQWSPAETAARISELQK
jgi:protein SCO1/2